MPCLRSLAIACSVAAAAPAAEAAVARYEYQGQDFVCSEGSECGFAGPGWTGFVEFDLDLLPGGTLSSTTVSLGIAQDPDSGAIVQSYAIDGTPFDAGFDGFVTYGGFLGEFLDFTVLDGGYSWSFDEAGDVVAWGGSNYCGGSCDPSTSTGGDSYDDGSVSLGPGTWTTVSAPPAPIPLPASAWLLAAGLAGLGLLRRARL